LIKVHKAFPPKGTDPTYFNTNNSSYAEYDNIESVESNCHIEGKKQR